VAGRLSQLNFSDQAWIFDDDQDMAGVPEDVILQAWGGKFGLLFGHAFENAKSFASHVFGQQQERFVGHS
jgi:hypothetical protein